VNDRETISGYLATWLDGKRHALKPKTLHRYTEIVVGSPRGISPLGSHGTERSR
jgi:hypothetical protein